MSSDSSDSPFATVVAIVMVVLVVASIMSTFWLDNRELLFYIVLGGIGIGLLTSIFFVVQVHRTWDPWPTEDIIVFLGGLGIWVGVGVTAWLAVHHPLYTEPTDAFAEFYLWIIQAVQLIGAVFLFLCIGILAAMQLVIGYIYVLRRQGDWYGQTAELIEAGRVFILGGVVVLLLLAFLLATGVVFQPTA
jgi:hypothetical protein